MFTFFLVCAAIGGTILACQFVMSLVGFGGDHSGDLHGGDVHAGDLQDVSSGGDHHSGEDHSHHDAHGHGGSSTLLTWLFSFLSLRSAVAGLTFFGLGGIAGINSGLSTQWTAAVAILSGGAAMYVVTMVMKGMTKLANDGTVRIQSAIGQRATVYIPIPAEKAGAGKVQIKIQNRLMEYAAVANEAEKLPTGAQVEVIDIAGAGVLEVRLVREAAKTG